MIGHQDILFEQKKRQQLQKFSSRNQVAVVLQPLFFLHKENDEQRSKNISQASLSNKTIMRTLSEEKDFCRQQLKTTHFESSWNKILQLLCSADLCGSGLELLIAANKQNYLCLLFDEYNDEIGFAQLPHPYQKHTLCIELLLQFNKIPSQSFLSDLLHSHRLDRWILDSLNEISAHQLPHEIHSILTRLCLNMSTISEGTYVLGGKQVGFFPNTPPQLISISEFQVCVFPVTQFLYDVILNNPMTGQNKAFIPQTQITWMEAIHFCNVLSEIEGREPAYSISYSNPEQPYAGVHWKKNANGYRLLSEAEWEIAAQGGEQNKYAGSNKIDSVALHLKSQYLIDLWAEPYDVGQYQPNGFGLYDMTGNVREWCFDSLSLYDNQAGHPTATHSPYRITRGGSCIDEQCESLYVANRGTPVRCDQHYFDLGFRIALGVIPSSKHRERKSLFPSGLFRGATNEHESEQEIQILESNGLLFGCGHDSLGSFVVKGSVKGNKLRFNKNYNTNQSNNILYKGTLKDTKITGNWHRGESSGPFELQAD
ncbi:MAG: hypothetical protein CMK59_07885 [Proteobacteria bacterium]|nr:hypothetical protein [Pseudomonadota bacterium]